MTMTSDSDQASAAAKLCAGAGRRNRTIPVVREAVVVALAWAVLAFGAVYPWAYAPVMVASAVAGVVGIVAGGGFRANRSVMVIGIGLAALAAAVVLQLIPIPAPLLVRIDPSADAFLKQYDLQYAAAALRPAVALAREQAAGMHPLSIAPASTLLGLGFLASFGLLFLGVSTAFSALDARQVVKRLIALAVLLALVGIIQRATFNGRMYGFWTPQAGVLPLPPALSAFGPFINRNHFAGWMLMILPAAIGYLAGLVSRGMRGVKPEWRDRLLWFSSAEASKAILVAFGILVMGVSLVMTISRFGITSFAASLVVAGWFAIRRQTQKSKRLLMVSFLVLVLIVSAGWAGFDAVAERFSNAQYDLRGRAGAWEDTLRIARQFPWFGTGLNTYGAATLVYQQTNLDAHLAEAHSDYLQLVAEGGVLLCAPALVVIGLFIGAVRARFREDEVNSTTYWVRLGVATGLFAIALQESVEFSLQMPANAALFAVVAGMAAGMPRNSRAG
jgi:O-antigen ligase